MAEASLAAEAPIAFAALRNLRTRAGEVGQAWDEAQALAELGRRELASGRTAQAAGQLGRPLETFQRIGAPDAAAVAAELDHITT